MSIQKTNLTGRRRRKRKQGHKDKEENKEIKKKKKKKKSTKERTPPPPTERCAKTRKGINRRDEKRGVFSTRQRRFTCNRPPSEPRVARPSACVGAAAPPPHLSTRSRLPPAPRHQEPPLALGDCSRRPSDHRRALLPTGRRATPLGPPAGQQVTGGTNAKCGARPSAATNMGAARRSASPRRAARAPWRACVASWPCVDYDTLVSEDWCAEEVSFRSYFRKRHN
ncbi:uncharacterized protein LOC119591729 [Penaeus monodon]|uniref:uncharacterized protein LOC119591729 n=1 Tax=Penaeus monodon TaxID=6687 RepID=UPI0018A73E60|nr:uncharacterized protein LOC119591729 [Penaeus monodon]